MRVLAASLGVALVQSSFLPEVEFEHFVKKFGKIYRDENERQIRYRNFKENVAEIEDLNSKGGSHTYRVGSLSDLSRAEFEHFYLGLKIPTNAEIRNSSMFLGEFVPEEDSSVASSIDWVSRGAVTPIKNQGNCGSCWTFSTTGAIEGAWQVATGTLLSLSEQQLVDCSSEGGSGCQGGYPPSAIHWEESQAICSESGYAYTAKNGRCHTCSSIALPKGSVIGMLHGTKGSTSAFKSLLNQAPVSVAVDASNWHNVGTGIFSNCQRSLNHAVLGVGYDSSSFKVKNSWGENWGDKGYVHLAIGDSCGVLDQMYLVKVSGSGPTPTPPPPSPPTPPTPDCKKCQWNMQCDWGQVCHATHSWGCCKSPAEEEVMV